MMKKFIVVLNKAFTAEQLLSALGHVTAGLSANSRDREQMHFLSYRDGDGEVYPHISAWSFIVLRGNGGGLKRLRAELVEAGMDYSCYLDSMISGGSDAQIEATKLKKSEEIQILALATFGDAARIDPLTKRFSLWRIAADSQPAQPAAPNH